MILRLLCIWLFFNSLLSSLMHGTMNLKKRFIILASSLPLDMTQDVYTLRSVLMLSLMDDDILGINR
jgi:hypothetical protein